MKGRLGKPDRTCVGILIFESAVRDRVSEIMVLLSDFAHFDFEPKQLMFF